jgi:hypothetical protein
MKKNNREEYFLIHFEMESFEVSVKMSVKVRVSPIVKPSFAFSYGGHGKMTENVLAFAL